MGIFRKQMLKVISWDDTALNTIVHKFEASDRYAIMKGSQLIVKPSQAAIFIYRGSVCDVFTEGNWKLEEGSTPILTKLANWKYAFENPKETDIYFVNLRRFTGMKWGTPSPVMMRDKDFGMIRVSGHGEYSFHVQNPALCMRECFGTIHSFRTQDIENHLRTIIVSEITDMLGECKIPALDLAANYTELGNAARLNASSRFQELGFEVDQLLVLNFKLPESVERAMDKRTTLGVFDGKMNDYAQFESVQAMRDSAKNTGMGGMFAGAGVGYGVGSRMGRQFANSIDEATSKTVKCPKCGSSAKENAKFCPNCGSQMSGGTTVTCSVCSQSVDAGMKFCPYCGNKMSQSREKNCPKCGATVDAGIKFCPECGALIK